MSGIGQRILKAFFRFYGPIRTEAPGTEDRLVLDSVDWRLYRHGGFVEEVRHGSDR